METWILIMFLSTSASSQSGAAAVNVEFDTQQACQKAGRSLAEDAWKRGNYVLTWGCFTKRGWQ